MADELYLGSQVLDKGIITADGCRAGKVDDLLLQIDPDDPSGTLPEVRAIATGPLALAVDWPAPLRGLMRWVYRSLGVHDPQPVVIPWSKVDYIHAVIHVSINRDERRLNQVADAIYARFLRTIPGA
jgi:sporulation protein YlmC with PRC-barrel domain